MYNTDEKDIHKDQVINRKTIYHLDFGMGFKHKLLTEEGFTSCTHDVSSEMLRPNKSLLTHSCWIFVEQVRTMVMRKMLPSFWEPMGLKEAIRGFLQSMQANSVIIH